MQKPKIVYTIILFAAVFIAFSGCGEESKNEQKQSVYDCLTDFSCKRLMIVAHRGVTYDYPENSLAAVNAAIKLGVDFAEVDVRETADDVLILMHDDTVNRTTNGQGEVSSFTYDEISQLKLKNCDESVPESCKIPTYKEVLSAAKEGGIMIYTDMKTSKVQLVANVISEGDFYEATMVRGYKDKVAALHDIDSKIEVMPSIKYEEIQEVKDRIPNLHIVEILSPSANEEFCTKAHELKLKVQQDVIGFGDVLAFVDDYSGWQKFIDSGIDVIQTNMPKELMQALEDGSLTLPAGR